MGACYTNTRFDFCNFNIEIDWSSVVNPLARGNRCGRHQWQRKQKRSGFQKVPICLH